MNAKIHTTNVHIVQTSTYKRIRFDARIKVNLTQLLFKHYIKCTRTFSVTVPIAA
jgi:hypothetical protein